MAKRPPLDLSAYAAHLYVETGHPANKDDIYSALLNESLYVKLQMRETMTTPAIASYHLTITSLVDYCSMVDFFARAKVNETATYRFDTMAEATAMITYITTQALLNAPYAFKK